MQSPHNLQDYNIVKLQLLFNRQVLRLLIRDKKVLWNINILVQLMFCMHWSVQFHYCSQSQYIYLGIRINNLYQPPTNESFAEDHVHECGPGSIVGIATGYGLDGPGIESRWGRDFPHLSRPALGPTQPPVQWVPDLSQGVKSGRGVTLTPHPFLVPLVMKEQSYTSTPPMGCEVCTEPQ